MKTNIKLIQLFTDSDLLRKYAVFLKLKHLYVNGCIFNYNVNSLSKKSGLSRNSINKYIGFFISEGWCKMHCNNLVFISHEALKAKYDIKSTFDTIIDGKREKTQVILTNLRYEILRQKTKQFNFLKGISDDLNNPTGPNALIKYKTAKRLCTKLKLGAVKIDEGAIKISLKKMSNLVNLSSASIHNLIKGKVNEKKATIIKGEFKRTHCKLSGKILNYMPGFKYNNNFYVPVCNKYVFL